MITICKLMKSFQYSKFVFSTVYSVKKSSRFIYTSPIFSVKTFREHENRFAYGVMENKGYAISLKIERRNTILGNEDVEKILRNCDQRTPAQLFIDFSLLGEYCYQHNVCISNTEFDHFIDILTDSVKHASEKELQQLLYSLEKWPETESIKTRNFIEVWAALDDECLNRINTWSFPEILSFVSLFYMLNVTRASDFCNKSLQKLASKARQLTSDQVVQTLFFIGVLRRSPFDMHNLEQQLDIRFQEFTIDDLAIMSMGFFKSKTPIRSMELVSKIINNIIANAKNIHELSLAALVKVIRYSVKISTDDKIYMLLDTLQHEVPRLSTMCNVHIALLGTSTLTLHEECLLKICDTVMKSISEMRLKDLERLVLTFGTFNFVPATKVCFFQKVMDELRKPERQDEIEKHGRCFACCIAYLGLLNIYPADLMNKVLSPEFLEITYGKHCYHYGREILTMHNTSQLFCREVNKNCLNDSVAKILAKKYTDFVPNENYSKQYNISEKMFIDIYAILKEIRGGSEYVIGNHIITHYQRGDIIMCNSHEGEPLPVGDTFDNKKFGLLRTPPDNNYWIVIVIAGRNSIIRNSDTPTGPFHAKIRELKALGFYPTLVPWTIYNNMKTKSQQINYLNKLINEALLNK